MAQGRLEALLPVDRACSHSRMSEDHNAEGRDWRPSATLQRCQRTPEPLAVFVCSHTVTRWMLNRLAIDSTLSPFSRAV